MSIPREVPSRHLSLPEPFNVEWMLHHVRTSSYGAPYRFVDPRILRRPLRLAGIPVVAEFDLTGAGTMGLRLVSLQEPGRPAPEDQDLFARGTHQFDGLLMLSMFLAWLVATIIEVRKQRSAADEVLGEHRGWLAALFVHRRSWPSCRCRESHCDRSKKHCHFFWH